LDELIGSGSCNAAIVATPTDLHRQHAGPLVEAGYRLLIEKPLTDSLESDREFVRELAGVAPRSVMLGLQRRFDPPLMRARELMDQGAIGTPFKVLSMLEDSSPVPDGYSSPGILKDMAVHNVDEVLWLAGSDPVAVTSTGSRLYSIELSTADENFDDAFLQVWFANGASGQVVVSRNHVSGYHVETWIFGDKGQIHVGHFEQNPKEVVLEVYGRDQVVEKQVFHLREYDFPLPEFVDRFGLAYKKETEVFVECCLGGEPFPVDQNDGLRAMEVIEAAASNAITRDTAGPIGQ
ncbi:MAG: Gfo/Idh/MocA family oxidoreductase, partial [bacterium]|nr:Gfo/Idh/MocA family oxidoreductase [bacterium]